MNPTEVISTLKARGIELWQEGDALRYRAPAGALTDREKAALKAHKASILKALAATAGATPLAPALTVTAALPAHTEPEPTPKDRLCYQCQNFQRSPYGYPLGLCRQHDDRIQHTTSQPTQFGCGEFTFRQLSEDNKTCIECRHYNPLSTMCSVVNTGCPYPSIPPCSGDKFQHRLKAVRPNKEQIKELQS